MTVLEWLIVIFAAWLAFGKSEPWPRLVFPEKPTRVPHVVAPPPPPRGQPAWWPVFVLPSSVDQARSFTHQNPPPQSLAPVRRQVNRPKPPVPVGPRTS